MPRIAARRHAFATYLQVVHRGAISDAPACAIPARGDHRIGPMDIDPILLARLQFAFTISFHIIFPSFTIGLSAYIATLEVLWLLRADERYLAIAAFWTKIFAVSFAMGVVSGIVLSYELGTNWSRFSASFGNVIGPLAGYEVLTAFFLEATFLAILLFGRNRVPPWLHVFSAIAVAAGTATSAFWILSANSWMHTPAGHVMRDGVAYPVDWLALIFNPSFPYRLAHMLNASYLTAGFVVLAVGARYLLAGRHVAEAQIMVRMAIGLLAVLAPLQLLLGDLHGLNTLKHQPIKIAAMEAHWDGSKPGDFHIFAWPDERAEINRFALSIPRGSSLVLTHRADGLFPGLKSAPPADRPPVPSVFFAFRIMLGIGFFMIAAALYGAWLLLRGHVFATRWYLHIVAHAWWIGFVAVIAGWVVTESGRQPWIVQGIMRTANAASPVVGAAVGTTLALFVLVYGIVFSVGIYYINRLIARGLVAPVAHEEPTGRPHMAPGFGSAGRGLEPGH
jgi:cytochrome d ubiquinol oxidase subunit I